MSAKPLSDKVLQDTVAAVTKAGNQRDAAKALGVRQSTLSDRLKQAVQRKLCDVNVSAPTGFKQQNEAEKDRKIIYLKDEVSRLSKALTNAHRETNAEDLLRELLGNIVDRPVEPPDWMAKPPVRGKHKATPEVPVSIFSDLHAGEVVQKLEVNGMNEYNTEIAHARTERYFSKLIELTTQFHTGNYPGLVLAYGGDMVSGGLHEELRKTDDMEAGEAALAVRSWMKEGIRRAVDQFGRVYIPGVAGNHGRMTHRPEFKKYFKKNWDWLIFMLLKSDFQDDKRVTFDFRPSNDVYFRVFNERYLLAHGDMLGVKGGDGIIGSIGPIMRGEVKVSGQSSAMGRPIDKLLIGHWHQRLWLPRTIVNNAVKGFDEFAMKALGAKPDRATQALWYVHPIIGMTAHWDIYVTKIAAREQTPWVSWQG